MKNKLLGVWKLTRPGPAFAFAALYTAVIIIYTSIYTTTNYTTFIALLISNIFCVASIFMINDVEDCEEDAKLEEKRLRNPVSAKILSNGEAYLTTFLFGTLVLLIYMSFDAKAFFVGLSVLVCGYLYSWKRVRLKTIPGLDVISHAYYFGFGLALVTLVVLSADFEDLNTLLLMAFFSLISIGTQLDNQILDFEIDNYNGLNTFATKFGLPMSTFLRSAAYFFCVVIGIYLFLPILRVLISLL